MKLKKLFDSNSMILTDGGLETTLTFLYGIELRYFAAFELLKNPQGRADLKTYFSEYLKIAREKGLPFLFETPTWRANSDWGSKMGYSPEDLFEINKAAVRFCEEMCNPETDLISGNIGPRGDGYQPGNKMTVDEAKNYHSHQIRAFKEAGADLVSALTINYPEEAIGITLAAREIEIPVVISFTVETDGKLPNGMALPDVINDIDLITGAYPEYYMINCAHPSHFSSELIGDQKWKSRIKGIRANASVKSHAELDESDTLDPGDLSLLAS